MMPEIRTSAAVTTPAPIPPVAAIVAEPVPAPIVEPAPVAAVRSPQPPFGNFSMGGGTLAPALGTTDLVTEEQTLAEMTAAAKKEAVFEATAPLDLSAIADAAVSEPAAVMAAPVASPMQPIASQAAAVAEAMAKAPAMRPAMMGDRRDIFMPRAAVEPRVEPRAEVRAPVLPLVEPAKPVAAAPPPAPTPEPAKPEGRLSLFTRYRSLTARKEPTPPKAPEPQTKVERPGMAISMTPQDRAGVSSHDEDELEIPAFLRRQAN
jgi:cell division protein FtsZ